MDQAKLIDMVTKELMRRLGMKGEGRAARPLLIVGTPGCCEPPSGLDVEYTSEAIEASGLGRYSAVAVASLTENQLVLASLGLKYGLESSFLVEGLLAGVPVYVLSGGVSWRRAACGEGALRAYYASCEERLRSFGARFSEMDGIAADLIKNPPRSAPERVASCGGSADARGRKVLTERDLKEICGKDCSEVLVDSRAVITPLAADWLRMKDISVRREGSA